MAAQTHRCGEKGCGDCQSDPQPEAAQEVTRGEMCHWVHRKPTRHRDGCRVTTDAVLQDGGEMRRVEGNLFYDADREQR